MALRKPILNRGWQQIVLIQAVGAKTLGHITNPTDCHAPVKNIYDLFCFYLRQTPCPATTGVGTADPFPRHVHERSHRRFFLPYITLAARKQRPLQWLRMVWK